jgi:hypothetical protein
MQFSSCGLPADPGQELFALIGATFPSWHEQGYLSPQREPEITRIWWLRHSKKVRASGENSQW